MPRSAAELTAELCELYGFPVDISSRLDGLSAIADALNRNEVAIAQIAALQWRLRGPSPDAPSGNTELALSLYRSGLLKDDWDPAKHPRWPAGAPEGRGGEFAPKDQGGTGGAAAAAEPEAEDADADESSLLVPVQITIPWTCRLSGRGKFPSRPRSPRSRSTFHPTSSGIRNRSKIRSRTIPIVPNNGLTPFATVRNKETSASLHQGEVGPARIFRVASWGSSRRLAGVTRSKPNNLLSGKRIWAAR